MLLWLIKFYFDIVLLFNIKKFSLVTSSQGDFNDLLSIRILVASFSHIRQIHKLMLIFFHFIGCQCLFCNKRICLELKCIKEYNFNCRSQEDSRSKLSSWFPFLSITPKNWKVQQNPSSSFEELFKKNSSHPFSF